jgi:hypothetical protein
VRKTTRDSEKSPNPETEYQFPDQKRKKITQMKELITKFDITMIDLSFQL